MRVTGAHWYSLASHRSSREVSACRITDEGCKALALLLEKRKPLKHLDLSNNQIGQQGSVLRARTRRPRLVISVCYKGVNHLRVVIPLSNIETLNVVGNNISVRIFGALQVMLMRTYVQLWSQGWVNSEVQKWVKDNVVRKREQQGTRAACARHDVSVTTNTFAAGRVGRPAPLPSDATRCAYTTWTRANH